MRLRLHPIACLAVAGALASGPADAQQCSPWLDAALAGALRPVLASTNPCASLRQEVDLGLTRLTVGLDHKQAFVLSDLSVCSAPPRITAKATFDIACSTEPASPVQLYVRDTVDVETTVRTGDCVIERFDIRPRGDVGRLLMQLSGFSERIRDEIAPHAKALCGR